MDTLYTLLTSYWAIRRHSLDTITGILAQCISGRRPEDAASALGIEHRCPMLAVKVGAGISNNTSSSSPAPASVALLRLRGPLFSRAVEWLLTDVRSALSDDNTCGLVLDIDGPGGVVAHTDQVAELLEYADKPVATVVTGQMASAHFWIGTAAERIFAASPLCEVGSVGVMAPMMSFKKWAELQGIVMRDIYPDSADLKNREVRDFEDNDDDTLIREHLARIHSQFSRDVARHLGISIDPEAPLFRGAMFPAAEALAAGYIHQMGNVDDAINWVAEQAAARKKQKPLTL